MGAFRDNGLNNRLKKIDIAGPLRPARAEEAASRGQAIARHRRAILFKLDVSAFKNCMAHFERMNLRPSVQKVVAYEKQVVDAFAKAA